MQKVPQIGVSPAKRPRNGFDRSETHVYSQPAGMLLPVFKMFLNPNDHVSIDASSIVQAQTLQGRPFLGMKQNFAFYFVPCRLLSSYSKSFFSGVVPKNTLSSSVLSDKELSSKVRLKAPSFKPYEVFCRFAGIPLDSAGKDVIDNVIFAGSAAVGSSETEPKGFHTGGYFGGKNRPNGRKSGDNSELASAKPAAGSVPSSSYTSQFEDDILKKSFGSYLFRDSHFYDILGYPLLNSYCRLSDMLGYGAMPNIGESFNLVEVTSNVTDYQANLFYWLAYQKIYQDHFLDTNFEKVNPRAYNVDDLLDTDDGTSLFDFGNDKKSVDRAIDIFSPRYVKYNKDLLSNIHPSPLFLEGIDSAVNSFFNVGSGTILSNSKDTTLSARSSISAADLRNLFALDKMYQISSRAPKTYRGQMLAHYGVDVPDDAYSSFYVGGFQNQLEVSPVIATSDGTADDSSTNFGQQGSYIDSSQNGHVNFDAKEHGILMCISWFSPQSLYDSDGVDSFNSKFVREDYFVPEFEDLGMQPIHVSRLLPPWAIGEKFRLPDRTGIVADYFEKNKDKVASSYNAVFGNHSTLPSGEFLGRELSISDSIDIYGWQPRYHEFKAGADFLHGEFKTGRSMQVLSVHRPTIFNFNLGVSNRSSVSNKMIECGKSSLFIPYNFLFVDPALTNDVVEVNYDGTEKTDPFRISSHFSVKYISDMSVSGLPKV